MTTNKTTPRPSANQQYNEMLATLQERLEQLEDTWQDHEARQMKDAGNWGYNGDLEHALEMLDRAAAALGDTQAQERQERPYGYR